MGVSLHCVQELHDEDAVSRASSASSSPRYSAALMAQVAAAMAASGTLQVGSPTGSNIQSFLLAHQAQQQRAQQAQHAQQMLQRKAALFHATAQSVAGQGGGSGSTCVAHANGALRQQSGSTAAVMRAAYGTHRKAAVPAQGNGSGTLMVHPLLVLDPWCTIATCCCANRYG